jgi:hypothetical protein
VSDHAARPAVSERRAAANRANARKSTGPRTEAGKRISSQNARKTPPCPFTFQLPAKFEAEWFHDALRRTAACADGRARLLLINRCMLQAHEIRWAALERTVFDVALDEAGGCVEDASLWLAQQVAAAKGLTTYHRWIAHRINLVERSLAALAAQSAGVEAEALKTMAAGAGGGSTFSEMTPSDLGPESMLPVSYSESGWSFGGLSGLFTYRVGAPQPPQPPRPPKPPTIGPIRGRYRLYLRCPAAPQLPNEAAAPSESVPAYPDNRQSGQSQPSDLSRQHSVLPQEAVVRPQHTTQPQQSDLPLQHVGLPPQPALLPQPSPQHCWEPTAATTASEPNPTKPNQIPISDPFEGRLCPTDRATRPQPLKTNPNREPASFGNGP